LSNLTPAEEGENPCPREYKTTTTNLNQDVGQFFNMRFPTYEAEMFTTQPRHSILVFYETDTGSPLTGQKATRVEAQAKSLRMRNVILVFLLAI
jgi:hypothetical protein